MGASLIHFHGRGFWAEHARLRVWLCLLAEEIGQMEPLPEWLQVARDRWHFQAIEDADGCFFANLDGHLDDDDRVNTLTGLSERALSRPDESSRVLSPSFLASLGLRGRSVCEVETASVVDVAERWLEVLRGESDPGRLRTVYYVTEFDGIQMAVTDKEVASDLWDFDAPVPLAAIEHGEIRASRQHPGSLLIPLAGMLIAGLFVYLLLRGSRPPLAVGVGGTVLSAGFVVHGALKLRGYFADRKRELIITTTDGQREVLYMTQHDPTFFAFLEGLKAAFAANQRGGFPLRTGEP